MWIFALITTFASFLILVQAGAVPTQPPLPAGCTIPCMDGVFVLDVSKSIFNDTNFNFMKDFVKGTFPLVNISAECSHAAVILFASDAWIRFDLNQHTDLASLTNAVDEIIYSDISEERRTGTNTPDALDLMRTAGQSSMLGLRDGFVHIGVFITDGRPNLKHIDRNINQGEANDITEVAGNRLHGAEIYDQIYAIGIEGTKPLGQTLEFIADPESLVFPIAGFDETLFQQLGRDLAEQFCNPCLLQPCPPGSECRICEETGEPYCLYSCAIDNGGCAEGQQCAEVVIPTCNPGECCSPVNVTCSACNLGNVDCVFVLDNSISIGNDTNFGLIRDLVIQITQQLTIGLDNSLVSVIIFARHAAINFTLTEHTNRTELIDAINEISYFDLPELNRTGTNIPDALNLLRTGGQDGSIGLRDNASFSHVIFITDGRPNTVNLEEERTGIDLKGQAKKDHLSQDAADTQEAAERLHDAGIYDETFAIGIKGTHRINLEELEAIASRPEFVFEIEAFTPEAFQVVALQLADEICTPCTGIRCPPGSECRVCELTNTAYCEFSCTIDNGGCPIGSTCSEETVACPKGQCCSPRITCEARCPIPCMDGVFVLDVSLSIFDDTNFNLMKDLVKSTFPLVNVSPECSHAAVILFASDAWIRFDLNEHTDINSLTNAVDEIVYSAIPADRRTGTNTPDALDLLRTAGQSSMLGLRDDFIHICVFITDGRPNLKHIDENINQVEANQITEVAGNRLHDAEIYDQIYAIGIEGTKPLGQTLEFIADPESLVFPIAGFNETLFEQLGRQIAEEFCNPCLRHQCPNGSECRVCEETGEPYCLYSCAIDNGGCAEGQQCTEVAIPTCNPGECCSPVNVTCSGCQTRADIVFVIDISLSIGQGNQHTAELNFDRVKRFLLNVVDFLSIGPENTMVGVVEFARWAEIRFSVSEYTDKGVLQTAISNLEYGNINDPRHETTNTPDALKLLRTEGHAGGALGLRDDVDHMVVFITDGRANTRKRTGNNRKTDAVNTEIEADLLHTSGIYDQIYSVGIRGKNNEINETQLMVIATDPTLAVILDDFTPELLEDFRQDLITQICGQQDCTAEDQVYSLNAPDCVPTCSDPNPSCSGTTQDCICPNGTVLDQIQNRCVSLSKCKCPQQCTHEFCTSQLVRDSRRPVPCMRGPPTTDATECMDPCKLTYCNACYYNETTLPTPVGCDNCCEDRLCLACVREWAGCVEERNKRDNECKGGCETAGNFKCYDYFGC